MRGVYRAACRCQIRWVWFALLPVGESGLAMPTAPREVDESLAREMGMTPDGFSRLASALGRRPTLCQLGVTSAMWREHCSYKSSRIHLKRLPQTGPRVVQGPGENAGAVDIGGGYCVVFKMESHNHPSYIEPFQG